MYKPYQIQASYLESQTDLNNQQIIEESPLVALMICGDLFEDFFDTIGVSFEELRTQQTGSWMFNYIDALSLANVRTVLIFVSERVSKILRFEHEPTGAMISVLPSPPLHRIYRKLISALHLPKRSLINSLYSYLVLPTEQLSRELKLQNCQAIIFQDYENASFDICVRVGRQLHVPTFASFQGSSGPRCRLEYLIRPSTMKSCAGVIIGSQREVNRVSHTYKLAPDKIARIFNPIDVKNWAPFDHTQMRVELGIPLNAQVIVSHGRIDIAHKGLDLLLEAWQLVCRQHSNQNLQLLLVGTGSDENKLHQLIEAMDLNNITWINEFVRDRTVIRKYLSASNIYVLASRYEGFPVAPIEAMACCLPVVLTDVPGASDILEAGEDSGGIVVPREDPEALAMALGRIIDDQELRQQLSHRAYKRAQQSFSLEVIGHQLRDFTLSLS